MSGVAPRGAPGVQVEGEEAQAQVEGDDDQRGVAGGQVETVDQVQRRQEEEQDQDAVQEPCDDVLEEKGAETQRGQSRVSTGFMSCEHTQEVPLILKINSVPPS